MDLLKEENECLKNANEKLKKIISKYNCPFEKTETGLNKTNTLGAIKSFQGILSICY